MRTSVRVRGVTYTSPDDARVGAEEIEHRADELAGELRARGKEGEADALQDRGHADAERLRAFAREREAGDAASTSQPAGAPRPSSKRPSGRSGGRKGGGGRAPARRAARPSSARSSSTKSAPRRFVERGYRRSGGAALVSSWGSLAWEIAGLSVLVALVTLFLQPRGVSAFGDLANGAAGLLALIVDPVDPLGGMPPVPPPSAGTSTLPGVRGIAPSPIPGAIPGAGGRLTPPAAAAIAARRAGVTIGGAFATSPANRRRVRSVVVLP